jgi:hypothetical protein
LVFVNVQLAPFVPVAEERCSPSRTIFGISSEDNKTEIEPIGGGADPS